MRQFITQTPESRQARVGRAYFSLVVTIFARLVMPAPCFPRFHGDDSRGRLAGIQNSPGWTPAFPVFTGMTAGVTCPPGDHYTEMHPVGRRERTVISG